MSEIIQTISKHPILATERAIRVKQISFIDFDIKEAKVMWEELFTDANGEPIIDDTIANRLITSYISNANIVTEQGIVIDSANFPKGEDESQEDYDARIGALKKAGFPEFDFYINAILNSVAIKQAIGLLDQLKRFDRK